MVLVKSVPQSTWVGSSIAVVGQDDDSQRQRADVVRATNPSILLAPSDRIRLLSLLHVVVRGEGDLVFNGTGKKLVNGIVDGVEEAVGGDVAGGVDVVAILIDIATGGGIDGGVAPWCGGWESVVLEKLMKDRIILLHKHCTDSMVICVVDTVEFLGFGLVRVDRVVVPQIGHADLATLDFGQCHGSSGPTLDPTTFYHCQVLCIGQEEPVGIVELVAIVNVQDLDWVEVVGGHGVDRGMMVVTGVLDLGRGGSIG